MRPHGRTGTAVACDDLAHDRRRGMNLRYWGHNRHGVPIDTRTWNDVQDVQAWVKAKHAAGFRDLLAEDENGREVAGINQDGYWAAVA